MYKTISVREDMREQLIVTQSHKSNALTRGVGSALIVIGFMLLSTSTSVGIIMVCIGAGTLIKTYNK